MKSTPRFSNDSTGLYNLLIKATVAVIVPTEIEAPTANSNLVYNETEQTGVNDGTGYTLAENKKTDAGTYQRTSWIYDQSDANGVLWHM